MTGGPLARQVAEAPRRRDIQARFGKLKFESFISKAIGQLYAKGPAILLNLVLDMKRGGRVAVFLVEQIVNAGRKLQALEQVLAEQGNIDDAVTRGFRAYDLCPGHGIKSRGGPSADILVFESGKELFFPERHAQVELGQVLGRIAKHVPRRFVLGL